MGAPRDTVTSLWLALSGRESHSTLGRQWGDCTPARGASWPQEDDLPFGPCGSCPVPGESWSASVCRDGLGGVARPFAVQSGAARPALLSRPPLLLPSLPSQRASGAGAAVHCLRSRHLVPLGTGWRRPSRVGAPHRSRCTKACRATGWLTPLFHTAVLNGRVHIRDWRQEKPLQEKQPEAKRRVSSEAFKTRLCWFFVHHPDGCVLPAQCCPFAHGPGELRPPPTTRKKQQRL